MKCDRGKIRRENMKKIADSRYNSWYRMAKRNGQPEYLKNIKKESKLNREVRFRFGDDV